MAVILAMTYQKKLGLPNYSSHSCSVSVTVEIPDVSVVAQESSKLYSLLQTAVDAEIEHVGFMPDASIYGMKPSQNGNGNTSNGHERATTGHAASGNGHNGHSNGSNGHQRNPDQWNCTDGQKGLVLRIINENKLNKDDVERMAFDFFGRGLSAIDKMQASQLIEELLEKNGGKSSGRRRWSPQQQSRS